MSEALSTVPEPPKSALHALASRLNTDPSELIETLKQGVFKGASDAEFQALTIISNEYELNPIIKEMYAFPAKGGGIVPIVGVDGWFKIMNRQPNLDGHSCEISEDGQSATVTIHLKDRKYPVIITEYFSECSRNTEPWRNMPKRMLRNRAYAQAIRIAFGVSGVFEEDEGQAFAMRNVTPDSEKKSLEVRNDWQEPEKKEQPKPRGSIKKEPEGKQEKARFQTDCLVVGWQEMPREGKPPYFLFELKNKENVMVKMSVFSSTVAPQLQELPPEEWIEITYTKTPKGMTLESWKTLDPLTAELEEDVA